MMGSPPQVRGILRILVCKVVVAGITPAGAGHTTNSQTTLDTARDHPRRCGAYILFSSLSDVHVGSPPQVRGIRLLCQCASRHKGITPAGAGHTACNSNINFVVWDHPRRCGAYGMQ